MKPRRKPAGGTAAAARPRGSAPPIPLIDIAAQSRAVGRELTAAVGRVLVSGRYILGAEGEAFEREFGGAVGARHCVGVSSGTQALQIALEALGVGPGDEVIVPAFTFIATANAVVALGALPVFADVDPERLGLDPRRAAEKVTGRTKALLPVHLYGCPADMDGLLALARERGLKVVEDAAQAHLAEWRGRPVGALGDAGCFSYYPTKNLGAAGDAGSVTTNDPAVAEACRILRNVARKPGDGNTFVKIGQPYRLDEVQAAVLRVKLRRLKAWTAARRRKAARYRKLLAGLPLALQPDGPEARHCHHLFIVRTPLRDALAERLKAAGIQTGVYYPAPLHLQPAYLHLGHREGDFPVAERAARENLALPLFPELPDSAVDRVAAEVRAFFAS